MNLRPALRQGTHLLRIQSLGLFPIFEGGRCDLKATPWDSFCFWTEKLVALIVPEVSDPATMLAFPVIGDPDNAAFVA